jgi:hypothetical protein
MVVDVKLGDLLTVFLTSKGEVFTMGDNICGQLGQMDDNSLGGSPGKVALEASIHMITCGSNHVYCYTKDCKQVYSWGSNVKNQILPNSTQRKFAAPYKITNLTNCLASKIVGNSRGTICISRIPLDFGSKSETISGEHAKKYDMQLLAERNEKDNLKKLNSLITSENNVMKQEILQLKNQLLNAEKNQKKPFTTSTSTQTQGDVEDNETVFDGSLLLKQ